MREHFWCYPLRWKLWDYWKIVLPKSENPINSPIWLGQVPSLRIATPIFQTNPNSMNPEEQSQSKTESKLWRSSPENNTSWRIRSRFILDNRVKIHIVWDIISWCPTAITIHKTIRASRICGSKGAGCRLCLNCRSAYFVRTTNQSSSRWFLQTEGLKLGL